MAILICTICGWVTFALETPPEGRAIRYSFLGLLGDDDQDIKQIYQGKLRFSPQHITLTQEQMIRIDYSSFPNTDCHLFLVSGRYHEYKYLDLKYNLDLKTADITIKPSADEGLNLGPSKNKEIDIEYRVKPTPQCAGEKHKGELNKYDSSIKYIEALENKKTYKLKHGIMYRLREFDDPGLGCALAEFDRRNRYGINEYISHENKIYGYVNINPRREYEITLQRVRC